MTNNVSGSTTQASSDTAAASTRTDKTTVNKGTFLQLLVAQIRNQNPLNPADGVQFLTQLAQFSELEQMMGIRTEIAALREHITSTTKSESGSEAAAGSTDPGDNNV
jgi:flagellar basal-body rod modification protein FlgD